MASNTDVVKKTILYVLRSTLITCVDGLNRLHLFTATGTKIINVDEVIIQAFIKCSANFRDYGTNG